MKEIQIKIKKFCKENNIESPVEFTLLDTISEMGELSKEVLKMSSYGTKKCEYKEEFAMELGDVLYSLITVANSFDVDLEDSLKKVLEKYERRLKKGSPGSEND